MRKHHYLSQEEENAIEDLCRKYKSRTLCRIFSELALKTESKIQPNMFSLSGTDLFYFVIYCVDILLDIASDEEVDKEKEMKDYSRSLWDYWVSQISSNRNYPLPDIQIAATLITSTLENCLHITKVWQEVRDTLISSGKKSNDECREKVEAIIEDVLYAHDNYLDVRYWFTDYLESNNILSDVIEDEIKQLRSQSNMQGLGYDEELINALKPYFWNIEADTTGFIRNIYGKSDTEIIEHLGSLAKKKKINKKEKSKLHKILNDKGFYKAGKNNFSEQLKNKGW